jgi:hypothetical protein
MENHQYWKGTATDLLAELEKLTPEKTISGREWPKFSVHLGKILTRLAPDLRAIGINIMSRKNNGQKTIHIENKGILLTLTYPVPVYLPCYLVTYPYLPCYLPCPNIAIERVLAN